MRLRVINLDRMPERYEAFTKQNNHVEGVERFSAFDGEWPSVGKGASPDVFSSDLKYSPGAKGNALSHVELWREVVDTGESTIIIEDDAILGHDFVRRARWLLRDIHHAWDIVMLGWNFDCFLWVDLLPGVSPAKIHTFQNSLRENVERFKELDEEVTALRLRHTFGLMCYAISPSGAEHMLNMLPLQNKLIPFVGLPTEVVIENRAIDSAMNGVYPNINAFVSFPPLAVSENRRETSSVPW